MNLITYTLFQRQWTLYTVLWTTYRSKWSKFGSKSGRETDLLVQGHQVQDNGPSLRVHAQQVRADGIRLYNTAPCAADRQRAPLERSRKGPQHAHWARRRWRKATLLVSDPGSRGLCPTLGALAQVSGEVTT